MESFTLKNGKTLSIRQIKGSDYEAVMEYLEVFSKEEDAKWTNQYPGRPWKDKEKSVKMYDSNDNLFLAAWDQDKIVGLISLNLKNLQHPYNLPSGGFGITILNEYKSNGLGSFLMTEMLKWAKERKVHRIEGMVKHENLKALGLYHKFGFQIEGIAREISRFQDKWQHAYYIAKILD